MLRFTQFSLALVLACAPLASQVTIHSGPFASSGQSSSKNVVRTQDGTLYCLLIQELPTGDRELRLRSSVDSGSTWVLDPVVLNDASSGMLAPTGTNRSTVAIDLSGNLHISWASYYEPAHYEQYYRKYDPKTGNADPIYDVSGFTAAPLDKKTSAMSIAVDGSGLVWIAAHGPNSGVERLLRSTLPEAIGGSFLDLGNITSNGNARDVRIAADANGLIHMTYFRSIAGGPYEHVIYDPLVGFGSTTTLGNSNQPQDYFGALAADALGNVHVLVAIDSGDTNSTWKLRYRKWDLAGGFGPKIAVFDATPADIGNNTEAQIFTIACDEATGRVAAIYRDLAQGGAMRVAVKELTDTGFTNQTDLTPGTGGIDEFRWPTVRGALHPSFNNSGSVLDITWHREPTSPTPPFSLEFQRASNGLDLGGVPAGVSIAAGGIQSMAIEAGSAHAGETYFLLGTTAGTTPGLPVDQVTIPLNIDTYFLYTVGNPNVPPLAGSLGTLDAGGRAAASFTLPAAVLNPAFAGVDLHHAYIVIGLIAGYIPTIVLASSPLVLTLLP